MICASTVPRPCCFVPTTVCDSTIVAGKSDLRESNIVYFTKSKIGNTFQGFTRQPIFGLTHICHFYLHWHWILSPSLWVRGCPWCCCTATLPRREFDVAEDWVDSHHDHHGHHDHSWTCIQLHEIQSKKKLSSQYFVAISTKKSLTSVKREECPEQCELWPLLRQSFQPFATDWKHENYFFLTN